jgi:YidC/Oxa1 family membrane protein insertase
MIRRALGIATKQRMEPLATAGFASLPAWCKLPTVKFQAAWSRAGSAKRNALGLAMTPLADSFQEIATTNPELVQSFHEFVAPHFITVRTLLYVLDGLHGSGLSWAGSIVALTFTIRMLLVPVLVYSSKTGVRLQLMKPELEELTADFNRRKALNQDARDISHEYSLGMMALYKKHQCNPFSMMVMPVVSMPIFISCFFAINGLCAGGVAGMNTGGALWFQNLTVMDPYYVLPVLSSWSGLLILKRGSESGGAIDPKIAPMLKVFSVVAFFAPAITYQLPAGVLLYFSAMSCFSLVQGEIIRADVTRRLLDMPTMSEMRIKKATGYRPFMAESDSVPPSPGPVSEKDDEGAKDKKTVRKKPLPLPFKKR